jgi:hypothetical protein
MNHFYLVFFFFITACTYSVNSESEEIAAIQISYGLSIDSEDRKLIQQNNKLLVSALKAKDWEKVQTLFSEQNLEAQEPKEFEAFVKEAGAAIESSEFELFDEFQVKTKDSLTEIRIESEQYNDQRINNYNINYASMSCESYVSLLSLNGMGREMLLTVVYGKYKGVWKIDQLYLGVFRIDGLASPEFYLKAMNAYLNNETYKAFTLLSLSKFTQKPGNVLLTYDVEAEMTDFYDKLFSEIANELKEPIKLEDISTVPDLYDLQIVHTTDNEYLPLVSYITHQEITDQAAIQKECDELNTNLPEILPGYTWHFDNVLYQAIEDDTTKTNDSLRVSIMVKPVVKS